MHYMSSSVFLFATLLTLVVSALSASMSLLYTNLDISVSASVASFSLFIELVASIVISVEAQTKLITVLQCAAQIDAATALITRMITGAHRSAPTLRAPALHISSPQSADMAIDAIPTLHTLDWNTAAAPFLQRLTALHTIRNITACTSTETLRTACCLVIVISRIFLQSRLTTSDSFAVIMSDRFTVDWPYLVAVMVIYAIAKETADVAKKYTA